MCAKTPMLPILLHILNKRKSRRLLLFLIYCLILSILFVFPPFDYDPVPIIAFSTALNLPFLPTDKV